MHIYNKYFSPLVLPVYGNHIQNLVNHIFTIKDKTIRTQYAYKLVSLMQKIHISRKNKFAKPLKFWCDLWVMSNYQLDVDAPYAKPEKIVLKAPQPLAYNTYKPSKYIQYYGYNIANYILKLTEVTDVAMQKKLLIRIVRLIVRFYKKHDHIDIILARIEAIAGNKLTCHFPSIKELFNK